MAAILARQAELLRDDAASSTSWRWRSTPPTPLALAAAPARAGPAGRPPLAHRPSTRRTRRRSSGCWPWRTRPSAACEVGRWPPGAPVARTSGARDTRHPNLRVRGRTGGGRRRSGDAAGAASPSWANADHRGLRRPVAAPRRRPQGRLHVHGRPGPGHPPAGRVRLHGRVVLRQRHQDQRRRAHREGPRPRPDRPPRPDRRGHRRQRPDPGVPAAEPPGPQPGQPRGVRPAGEGRPPAGRSRPALRRFHDPARLRRRLRARRRRALPQPALRLSSTRGSSRTAQVPWVVP